MITRRYWALCAAVAAFVAPLALASPAVATPPDSDFWPDPGNPPLLQALLVVVGIPILLFAGIFLLTYLPSMIRSQRGTSVETWRDEPEWFGGPRKGPAAVEPPAGATTSPEPGDSHETGGASARW